MNGHRLLRILKFVLLGVLAIAVFGFLVMGLWNWLLPGLFGLPRITFLQALGLLILSKIFFGGFRGGPGHRGFSRRRMIERWEKMTPEEREKFRQGFRGHCGPLREPIENSNEAQAG
jgi:hypothetical protein